jgi:hypothetical protein
MRKIIVSAADSKYYELLIDLISSIEDGKGDSESPSASWMWG